jgi:hypothetical protein
VGLGRFGQLQPGAQGGNVSVEATVAKVQALLANSGLSDEFSAILRAGAIPRGGKRGGPSDPWVGITRLEALANSKTPHAAYGKISFKAMEFA